MSCFVFYDGGLNKGTYECARESEAFDCALSLVRYGGWQYLGVRDEIGSPVITDNDPVQKLIDDIYNYSCRRCPDRPVVDSGTFFRSEEQYLDHLKIVHSCEPDMPMHGPNHCAVCDYDHENQDNLSVCQELHFIKGECSFTCECGMDYGYLDRHEQSCKLKAE